MMKAVESKEFPAGSRYGIEKLWATEKEAVNQAEFWMA